MFSSFEQPTRTPVLVAAGNRLYETVLPELAALRGRPDHGVAFVAVERLGEFGHVLECFEDAVFGQWMRIGLQPQTILVGPRVGRPDARKGDEETLVGRQAVDHRPG